MHLNDQNEITKLKTNLKLPLPTRYSRDRLLSDEEASALNLN